MLKKLLCAAFMLMVPVLSPAEDTLVTISPLYDNPAFRLGGLDVKFIKYDMQRYRVGAEWRWTINFCEVVVNGQVVAKINSEAASEGQSFTAAVAGKSVHVAIRSMPKVTAQMECRGPVQPCWTKSTPVSRAKSITLEIRVDPQ